MSGWCASAVAATIADSRWSRIARIPRPGNTKCWESAALARSTARKRRRRCWFPIAGRGADWEPNCSPAWRERPAKRNFRDSREKSCATIWPRKPSSRRWDSSCDRWTIRRRSRLCWNSKTEKSNMRRVLGVGVALAMVLSLPFSLEGIVMFDSLVSVPVSRLIRNTTRYIKAHPKDSQGYYLLGRLHSFAFAGNPRTEESKYSRLFGPDTLPDAR